VVAVVVTTVAAVASCYGSVATATLRGDSPVVTVLPTARANLDERRLVGTNASDLSALPGARAGTIGATLRTRRRKTEIQPLETGTFEGGTAYLKVEKFRFLFLEDPADAAVAPVPAAALPDASVARAGASEAHAASSTDDPVAGASAPTMGAYSSAAFAALGDGGGGFHLSGGACPPSLSSSSDDDDEFSGVAGGESPCCSCSQ
jgi:hypothetical protein